MKVLLAFGGVKSRYHPTGDVISTNRMAEAIQQYSKHELRLLFPFGDETDYHPCKDRDCAKDGPCEKCSQQNPDINMVTYAQHILSQDYDILFVRGNLLMQHIYHNLRPEDTRPRILFWVEESSGAGNDPKMLAYTNQIDRDALACADYICGFTEEMLRASEPYMMKSVDATIMPICIRATDYRIEPPKQLETIGYAGGYNPMQDISPLLEILSSEGLPYRVLIACPSELGREKYGIMCKMLGITDRVEITSYEHEDMARFYERSDILLYGRLARFPPDDKAISTKMLEYMSTGRPILLTENAVSAIRLLPPRYPLILRGDCSDLGEKLAWLREQDIREFCDRMFDCALQHDMVNIGGVIGSRFDNMVDVVTREVEE